MGMTDMTTADTYGGGEAKRKDKFTMPRPVPAVPTFTDPGIVSDSDKVVQGLKTDLERLATVNRGPATSPLKEIAQRIKKLIHDDGEQFGNELEAKMKTNHDKTVSTAKALQLWADDTLRSGEGEKA
jgi:hypothetical protein